MRGSLGCAVLVFLLSSLGASPSHAATVETSPRTCQEIGRVAGQQAREVCMQIWRSAKRDGRQHEHLPPGLRRKSGGPSRERSGPSRRHGPEPAPSRRRDGASTPSRAPGEGVRPTTIWTSPVPSPGPRAVTEEPLNGSLPPIPLLGLLLLILPLAVVGLTVRRRALAPVLAVGGLAALATSAAPARRVALRDVPDPFAVPVLALDGQGGTGVARSLVLSALETADETCLVVLPCADAMALFGLDEDDLLDESLERLFLPGTLDAALAFLETELSIRDGSAAIGTEPRLLLVADCERQGPRIAGLSDRHPGGFSAVVLGDWPDDQVTIAEDGQVSLPLSLAGRLPEHVQPISRSEARDRLAALARAGDRRPTRPKRRRRR
ncbi:hypothetical protein [Thermomonospora umbrina]|uniref:hypothetical protein n=1 Tax=Thermomonospora umbrina TaxID=111806 RepID=UPI0011C12F76|nr:hypothetical protein [Thermomonospora umbrina]